MKITKKSKKKIIKETKQALEQILELPDRELKLNMIRV
jgi:hypothetical protein